MERVKKSNLFWHILIRATLGLGVCLSNVAVRAETRGYVVSWFHFAPYSTPADCPKGTNPTADKLFSRILTEQGLPPAQIEKIVGDDDWVNKMGFMVGDRGRINGQPANVYLNPTSVPDPKIFTGQGNVGLGFNLDGKEGPDSFVDPETREKGVDNQFFRAVGCVNAQQGGPGARPTHPSIVWDTLRDQMPAWLIEIDGIDDIVNDGDVEVKIIRAIEPVMRNAAGEPQQDMTFREDLDPRSYSIVRGKIENGQLTTGSFDFNMVGDPYLLPEFHGRNARLRLKLSPDGSVKGILGVYMPWKDLYQAWALGGGVNESNLSMDLPGLYYALKRLADAYPDPKTGQNTAISTSYVVEAIPAYIRPTQKVRAAGDVVPLTGSAPLLNPPGITLKPARVDLKADASVRGGEAKLVFADSKGRPLYASDDNFPSSSSCDEECAKTWIPFIAPAHAVGTGEWSTIVGKDGARQWTLRGKPLYTHAKDAEYVAAGAGYKATDMFLTYAPGSITPKGEGAAGGWHAQRVIPADPENLPRGISLNEVMTVPGITLVDSARRPLYVLREKIKTEKPLSPDWRPFLAPAATYPIGEFSAIRLPNGDNQWSWKGHLLYTYAGDLEIHDANGKGVDNRMEVATVFRYFTPDSVAMRKDQRRGGVLVEASTGNTLYLRDRIFHDHTGGHSARSALRGNPLIGTAIGTSGCDAQCEKMWKPLLAPEDAQPSGLWSVFERPDKRKQWGYRGYALYTNSGEKPGEVTQNDAAMIVVNDTTTDLAPSIFGLGLNWHVASP